MHVSTNSMPIKILAMRIAFESLIFWVVALPCVGETLPLQALKGDDDQSTPDLIPRIRHFAPKKAILGIESG